MITASDARALGAVSDDKADDYLRVYVEPKIIAAARVGKTSVFYMVGSRSMWQGVAISPLHRAIVTRLQALGYTATWQNSYGEFYTPIGEGSKTDRINYGILISWEKESNHALEPQKS